LNISVPKSRKIVKVGPKEDAIQIRGNLTDVVDPRKYSCLLFSTSRNISTKILRCVILYAIIILQSNY